MSSKMGSRRRDDCGSCLRYLLIIFNVLAFLPGLALVATGVFLLIDRNYMSIIMGNALYSVAIYFLIACGVILLVLAFLGCCGAVLENRCMIVSYFVILSLIFLLLVVAGVLAIVFKSKIGNEVTNFMQRSLQDHYGVSLEDPYNRAVTEAWDKAQRDLYCCGVLDQSWGLYKASKWFAQQPGVINNNKPQVPLSCCVVVRYNQYVNPSKCQTWALGPPSVRSSQRNEAIYYTGCYTQGVNFLDEHSRVLIGLGIGIALMMLLGIVNSVLFYRYID